jgi:hypothetical protein
VVVLAKWLMESVLEISAFYGVNLPHIHKEKDLDRIERALYNCYTRVLQLRITGRESRLFPPQLIYNRRSLEVAT